MASKSNTINVTLRIPFQSDEQVKELAKKLSCPTSQIYRWLVQDALEIINEADEQPYVPDCLQLLKGISKGTKK
tara:strand:- start:1039 stop:1260 length:222 start_codon:yes stop_codon:yes gene_type:complete